MSIGAAAFGKKVHLRSTDLLMPSDKCNSIMATAAGLISSLFNVTSSVSQSVSRKILLNKKFLEFYINFVEGFMVDLKTFLSLAMPNQSCPDVTS